MKQAGKSVVQPLLNTCLEVAFERKGWEAQVDASPGADLVCDFGKEIDGFRVLVEVQFANSARQSVDLEKFRVAWQNYNADVGVVVTLDKDLAKITDSNTATFEGYLKSLRNLGRTGHSVPTLILGLSRNDADMVDVSTMGYKTVKELTGKATKGAKFQLAHKLMAMVAATAGPTQVAVP